MPISLAFLSNFPNRRRERMKKAGFFLAVLIAVSIVGLTACAEAQTDQTGKASDVNIPRGTPGYIAKFISGGINRVGNSVIREETNNFGRTYLTVTGKNGIIMNLVPANNDGNAGLGLGADSAAS